MHRIKITLYLFLFTVFIFFVGCSDKLPHDTSEESQVTYSLTVLPAKLNFSETGGEISLAVSAKKIVTTTIDGHVSNVERAEAPYTVTVSGEGFSWNRSKVSAAVNEGEARTGVATIVIGGTDESTAIQIEQEASSNQPLEPGKKDLKILAIGNSFSVDAVEQYLYEIAFSMEDTFTIGNMFRGSAELKTHSENAKNNEAAYAYRKIVNGKKTDTSGQTLKQAIVDEAWDIITIQQVSTYSGFPETFDPYVDELLGYIKEHATNNEVKIGYHMAWAAGVLTASQYARYNHDQLTMYNAIVNVTKSKAAPKVDFVIPAGTAIQNGRTVLGDTYTRDNLHLELTFGRYTAALTWYQQLTGRSVIDAKYIPNGVSGFQAKVSQYAAYHAVEKPDEVTSLGYLEE